MSDARKYPDGNADYFESVESYLRGLDFVDSMSRDDHNERYEVAHEHTTSCIYNLVLAGELGDQIDHEMDENIDDFSVTYDSLAARVQEKYNLTVVEYEDGCMYVEAVFDNKPNWGPF